MTPLPKIMVAPNGARRGKADHPALPVTDAEIVATARTCFDAGADGMHFHLRDANERHLLDAGRYRSLIDRLTDVVPDMYLQVTSETAGRYTTKEQQDMVRALKPAHVSVGLREMVRGPEDWKEASRFYHWAADNDVEIQHILYSPDDVCGFLDACDTGKIPGQSHLVLFVQGSYANGSRDSIPIEDYLSPFAQSERIAFDWMVCAFGRQETASLAHAATLGGKARVGFENSLWHENGELAQDNAARVNEVASVIEAINLNNSHN